MTLWYVCINFNNSFLLITLLFALFFEFNLSNASCLSRQLCNNLKLPAFKNIKQSNLENNFLYFVCNWPFTYFLHPKFLSSVLSRGLIGFFKVVFCSALAPTHHPSKIITSGTFLTRYQDFFFNLSSIALLNLGSLC